MAKIMALAALLIISALEMVESGLVETRLLKSKDADKNDHQYHVALFHKVLFMPEVFDGSGALISNTWVVTSANVAKMVIPFSFLVRGKVKAGLPSLDSTPIQALDVEKVFMHDGYDRIWQSDNDIGLVKVKNPGFTENEQIKSISFASEVPNGQVIVTSWLAEGKENVPLQELSMVLQDKASCRKQLKKVDLEIVIDDSVFCVENSAKLVTGDDLGSTAISVNGDQRYLVGIFSSIMEAQEGIRARGTLPAIFTNVTHHESWIKNNMT